MTETFGRLKQDVRWEMLKGFRQAGYDFSADQLIRIRNHHVGVEDFAGFRAVGYDLSVDEIIKIRASKRQAQP